MSAVAVITKDFIPHCLSSLNEVQQLAALQKNGPLLILAGAGTGKTKVLTSRIAYILESEPVQPYNILAVTFTNKAAQEMRNRINSLIGHGVEGLWIGTFHSLCVRILRRHAELIGFSPQFTIIDTDDQLRLIKQLLKAENVDEKQLSSRFVVNKINRWKDKAKFPDMVTERELALTIYRQYQERLAILNAMDFGDLLLNCLKLFQEYPDVLGIYQHQLQYLLVDEYQDTNMAQYLWLRLLAAHHKNICCVGDDDQSIYGWRGAEIGNILKFEEDFPGAKIIRLEQNYRSTHHILAGASGLIANNTERLGKELWTEHTTGERILVRGTWDNQDEARFMIEEVENAQRHNVSLNEMAILVRASYQTRDFEERCLRTGISYRVIGGLRFYERQEIRDALAYIRLLVQPDDGLAFERIVNLPKRGVGDTTIQKLHQQAREQNISLPAAAYAFAYSDSKTLIKNSLREFFDNFDRWRRQLLVEAHVDVVKAMLDESGYTLMWMQDQAPDAPTRLENLKELVSAIEEFQYLPGFLDHVSLITDNNAQVGDEAISLMTLHAAKGLEFEYVFLPGWEENIFPHSRALNDAGMQGLEEERRLGYVGISRAKKKATITYTLQRRMPHQGWQLSTPSRFLREIPNEHIIHVQANGLTTESSPGKVGFAKASGAANHPTFKDYKKLHLRAGDRVFHQKFGYGEILEAEFDQAVVQFELSDIKKIHINYLELAE